MRGTNGLFIDGSWVAPASGHAVEVLDAATEEVVETVMLADATDVDRAVASARRAFDGWAATPLTQRIAVVERSLDLLTERAEEIARTITREVGTPLSASREIQAGLALADIRLTVEAAREVAWTRTVGNSLVVREPVGVVAAITPWNYPLHQVCAKVAPALIAGCPVVLKPSELAPLTAYILADALAEAGLPPGVFNLLPGTGAAVGSALAGHPDVDMVSLTGSVAAGSAVMRAASEGIRRVALELGGKSSMVVLGDAPLADAVGRAVSSCFSNNGQMCSALTRLLVRHDQIEEATQLAAAAAEAHVVGDPLDPATTVGPLVSRQQRQRVQAYVRAGIDEGAKLVAGGAETPAGHAKGYFVAPTVFTGVSGDMRIAQEEIFGPVLTILAYRDDDEAVALANGTDFGLSGAVWSDDPARAEAVARRLRTGQVSVNGGRFNPAAPFGGYKKSGIGRELGVFGLEEYLETKAIHR
jgi:aldehyde dehydrogenase (NAD+)